MPKSMSIYTMYNYFYTSGTPDSVAIGGMEYVRLASADYVYDYVKASSKPAAMALRLVNKLFSKETLLYSTLYGTKEYAALDPSRIAAIKGKLRKEELLSVRVCRSVVGFARCFTKHQTTNFVHSFLTLKKWKCF